MTFVKIRDLIAAEEALESAEQEARSLRQDPDQWSAFEIMDRRGKRSLVVSEAQFQRQDFADAKVREAQQTLLALRQQFAPCACQHDGQVA
jgi:hypothetical protein